MLPSDALNPFLIHRADDTLTLPPGHVSDLHADAVAACKSAIRQADQAGQGVGMLLIGEAGSGKSHLLAQLRHQAANSPRVAFAAVRLGGAYTGRLWRPLRARLVDELLRLYPSPAHGANGLLRLLKNQLPAWASAAETTSGGLLDWQLGRRPRADLAPHLDAFQLATPLDPDLASVLPRIGDPATAGLALAWLRGKQCPPEQLTRLGLSPHSASEADQEAAAQEVVLSLARLAAPATVLVLCFDEVEAIQGGNRDVAALRSFATMLTAILAETGPRLVLASLRPTICAEMQKAAESSNMQKIGQLRAYIPPLTRPQLGRLVAARVAACRGAEPPGEAFLDALHAANPRALTPRAAIVACHTEYERRNGHPAPAPEAAPVEAPRGGVSFQKAWEKRRDLVLKSPGSVPFGHVMATGLPWLAGLTGLPAVPSAERPAGMGDVDLTFEPRGRGGRALWVSFCDQPPQQLWRRLDRLIAQWRAGGRARGGLVLLRPESERPSDAARRRFDDLEAAGVRLVSVTRQALAELAAFAGLMTAALMGELVSPRGLPYGAAEYDAWAGPNLSGAVKGLLDEVFAEDKLPQAATPA